jgi:CMP-N-acetylneuraminic acid synthetase
MRYLLIIPARGGSKSIPKKNIIDVAGKPLIAYSIEVANELKKRVQYIDCIVSTDSKEIAKVSEEYGADVPFLRPSDISGDKAKSISFILHALEFQKVKGKEYDAMILLQPTSPLRTVEDLLNAIEIFEEEEGTSLISVYKEEYINDLVSYKKEGNKAIPLNPNHNKGVRRQDHGAIYVRNGSIYITKVNYLLNNENIISDNPLLFEMSKGSSINIDTPDDLELIRWVLSK